MIKNGCKRVSKVKHWNGGFNFPRCERGTSSSEMSRNEKETETGDPSLRLDLEHVEKSIIIMHFPGWMDGLGCIFLTKVLAGPGSFILSLSLSPLLILNETELELNSNVIVHVSICVQICCYFQKAT